MKILSKNSLLIIFAVIISSCNATNSNRDKSDRGKSIAKEDNLYQLVHHADRVKEAILISCFEENELSLPPEIKLTIKMFQLMKYTDFSEACGLIQEQFVAVSEVELKDMFFSKDDLLVVYRYKFEAEKIDLPIELRIVFTKQKKLTEFQFYEWVDVYSEDLIKMNWF